ncbi:MAG: hypothetical protein Q4E65_06425 [Clostridia bacterium]|nr:hypothetical protein [Clostridia bacterium]
MENRKRPTVADIYAALDNDLAWDNLEHDLPAADLADLEHSLPGANGEDF